MVELRKTGEVILRFSWKHAGSILPPGAVYRSFTLPGIWASQFGYIGSLACRRTRRYTPQPMHTAFEQLDHRPWPVPKRRWTWRQSWRDLAFLHWPVPVAALRPHIPARLTVQQYDGTAWLGIVPFRMAGVMRRPFPDMPGISAFPELNVRTYVDIGEGQSRPGVWFFSLDATNRLAVWAARRFFHLPYYRAAIEIDETDGAYAYSNRRKGGQANFVATYRPTSEVYLAKPDTLEQWLTERYCLYAETPKGKLLRAEVHHHAWPLQEASVSISENDMMPGLGVDLVGAPSTVHFSKRIDVAVWSPEPVG